MTPHTTSSGGAGLQVRARRATEPATKEQLREMLRRAVAVSAQIIALIAFGMTDEDLEKLVGRSRATLYSWRKGSAQPPQDIAQRIDDTRYLIAALLADDIAFDPASLLAWFRARSFDLNNRRPLDVLIDDCDAFDKVYEAGRRFGTAAAA